MKIGKRNLDTFLRRITEPASYSAFARMFLVHEAPQRVQAAMNVPDGIDHCDRRSRNSFSDRVAQHFRRLKHEELATALRALRAPGQSA